MGLPLLKGCLSHDPKNCGVFITHDGSVIGHSVMAALPKGGLYPSLCWTCQSWRQSGCEIYDELKSNVESNSDLVGILRMRNCSYADKILHYSGLGTAIYHTVNGSKARWLH